MAKFVRKSSAVEAVQFHGQPIEGVVREDDGSYTIFGHHGYHLADLDWIAWAPGAFTAVYTPESFGEKFVPLDTLVKEQLENSCHQPVQLLH